VRAGGQGRIVSHYGALLVAAEAQGVALGPQGVQIEIPRETGIHYGIQIAVDKAAYQIRVAVLPQGQVYLGVLLAHSAVYLHQVNVEVVPEHTDRNVSREALLGKLGGVKAVTVAVQYGGALAEKGFPGRGQRNAAGVAVEKLDLHFLLQGGDSPAQGRLSHEQIVGGLGVIQLMGQRQEAFKLICRHGSLSPFNKTSKTPTLPCQTYISIL